jgi:hypothetical protein
MIQCTFIIPKCEFNDKVGADYLVVKILHYEINKQQTIQVLMVGPVLPRKVSRVLVLSHPQTQII